MTVPADERRLIVLAIGGHGLSAPTETGFTDERRRIEQLEGMLRALVARGYRLLVVHGNGPQVGRLLSDAEAVVDLDIHTAQTQGELGYLITRALPAPNAALITRVVAAADLGQAIKPIGPVLTSPLARQPCEQTAAGWRLLVPSPRPQSVIELELLRGMLATHHVVAGGGGGIPLSPAGDPIDAVIDKDWVAALLAVELQANLLVFGTDVDGVYEGFGTARACAVKTLSVDAGRALLASGGLGAGSMAPKLGSALQYVQATGERACICAVEQIAQAIDGKVGTQIES